MATGVLLGLSGCTDVAKPRATSASASPVKPAPGNATSSGRAEHIGGETVTRAPEPGDGTAVLQVASQRGNVALPLTKKVGTGRLAIHVNCQGKGTLTVSVWPIGVSFPLACADHEVSSTYNEIHLKRPRSEATIHVSASSAVHWALTAEQ
ncbi:hypothetical protein ABZ208_35715 [Streptomyces sp. NPDC006208]|uniref:hypothetical protein n=1 Tax=Streptomyces sp. NPDC006208 TaxID=3156734 RepID=UPI0033B5BDB2